MANKRVLKIRVTGGEMITLLSSQNKVVWTLHHNTNTGEWSRWKGHWYPGDVCQKISEDIAKGMMQKWSADQ